MSATSVRCPECRSRLNPAQASSGGKLRCPRCGAACPVPRCDALGHRADDEDEPWGRPRRRVYRSRGVRALLVVLGLSVAGVLLLLVGVGLLASGFWKKGGPSGGAGPVVAPIEPGGPGEGGALGLLVGVAVANIDNTNIGMAVPHTKLQRLLEQKLARR